MIRVAANLCTVLVGQGRDTLRNPENLSNKKQQCSFSQREAHCQSCAANWGTARERESHRIYIRNTSTFLFKVRGGWESSRRAYESSSKQDPWNRAGLNLKHSEMTLQRKTEKEKLWLVKILLQWMGCCIGTQFADKKKNKFCKYVSDHEASRKNKWSSS